MVKIVILNDDRCDSAKFAHIHGFSAWIDVDGFKFLFDVGQEDCFIQNANILGIDLNQVKCIVLSHGDYDHGNGLKFLKLNRTVPLICHPDFELYRKSKRTGNFDGLNQTKEELSKKYDIQLSRKSFEVSNNLYFLGQIKRNSFETANLPMVDENGNDYQHLDDTGVAIKTKAGIIVVAGCSHSGICNIVSQAQRVSGDKRVLAVVGGFHLKKINEQTDKTIEFFLKNKVQNIILGHCTSNEVCEYFKQKLGGKINVEIISTGSEFEFDEKTLERHALN